MSQIIFEDLSNIKKTHPKKTIVFCSGGFDLTHPGHILFFEDCKKYGDILVVGVGTGSSRKEKGAGRPIMNAAMRLKMVSSLKPVDYAFITSKAGTHKLDPLEKVLEVLRPDVYIINNDANEIPYREKMSKKFNVKLVILERWCPPEFENISTTALIEKIKKLPSENQLP